MALTAAEQYLLELINRARLDPQAEADRYGVGLNSGLAGGTIDTSAKQVLAHNTKLEAAAKSHGDWMLRTDQFSHTGAGGSSPGERMADAGYQFSGSWTWRENLAWTGSTGSISLSRAIEQHHEGLYRSAGHRANTFAEDIREIGVAQVSGKFSYQGNTYNASLLTEKFAKSGANVFVTGVSYNDRDGDDFYSIGEGRSGVWVRAEGKTDNGGAAGGYGVATKADAATSVKIGYGNTTKATLRVDTTDGNVKLDMVRDKGGDWRLDLSGNADLAKGIADARLLGVADLDLSGSGRANRLEGNDGDNVIAGEAGGDTLLGGRGNDELKGNGGRDTLLGGRNNDTLKGGGGNDTLRGGGHNDKLYGDTGRDVLEGGKGRDRLDGGSGNDRMRGEGGADTFVFRAGNDVIEDFANNTDTIAIHSARAGSVREALAAAEVVNGDVVFDFGKHSLTIEGVSNIGLLENDLVII